MFRCGISLFPCEKQKVAMKVFQPSLPLISQASPLNTLPLSPVPRAERGLGTRGLIGVGIFQFQMACEFGTRFNPFLRCFTETWFYKVL